jgi:hypothetical protein
MLDICTGSIVIPESCDLPLLSSNGSLLIFTDITLRTKNKADTNAFTIDYYIAYEVLSKTHRILSNQVLYEQKNFIKNTENSFLSTLLIWTFCIVGITLLYGVPVLKGFIDGINLNKNMLAILPISIAK